MKTAQGESIPLQSRDSTALSVQPPIAGTSCTCPNCGAELKVKLEVPQAGTAPVSI